MLQCAGKFKLICLYNSSDCIVNFDGDPAIALKNITGATQADPVVVTSASHGLNDNDIIFIDEVVGMTEINEIAFQVDDATTDTFSLNDLDGNDIDGTGYTAYSSNGKIAQEHTKRDQWMIDYIFSYGTGQYIAWFTNTMIDTNYSVQIASLGSTFGYLMGTGSYKEKFVKFGTKLHDGTLTASEIVNVTVWGGK